MSLQAKALASPGPFGLYMHVPFCASACEFCAFYQEAPRRGDIERFLDGMEREAAWWREQAGWRAPGTVFWGGGTPGLLPARDLRRLAELVHGLCGGSPAEWSVEMAPGTVKADKLAALREAGVTRVSMGVQSFDDALLEQLGRQHNRRQVMRAWERVREAGLPSTNLDLMFALPGQDEAQLRADLEQAAALGPGHLSTYCLTFEEDTKLWARLASGQLRRDVDAEERLYVLTWETLEAAGYGHYEVSNFARPGHRCQHNINTWRMHEWAGLGPSAASQFAGRRFANAASLDAWLAGLEAGTPAHGEVTALGDATLAADALVFGLRMAEGVDLAEVAWRFPGAALPDDAFWARLVKEGLAVREGPRVRLSNPGLMRADAIGGALLEEMEAVLTPIAR